MSLIYQFYIFKFQNHRVFENLKIKIFICQVHSVRQRVKSLNAKGEWG